MINKKKKKEDKSPIKFIIATLNLIFPKKYCIFFDQFSSSLWKILVLQMPQKQGYWKIIRRFFANHLNPGSFSRSFQYSLAPLDSEILYGNFFFSLVNHFERQESAKLISSSLLSKKLYSRIFLKESINISCNGSSKINSRILLNILHLLLGI
jgi:hypothetical protein